MDARHTPRNLHCITSHAATIASPRDRAALHAQWTTVPRKWKSRPAGSVALSFPRSNTVRDFPLPHVLSLSIAVAGALASLAAQADDDRFTLRLGAMQANGDARLRGSVDFEGDTYGYTSDKLDFGDDTAPRVEGIFHFSERNRLLFNYFQYDRDKRYELGDDVVLGDTTIPAGSMAKASAEFSLGSVVYDYALVETPTTSFGLQIGAEWARLEGNVYATDGSDSFESRDSESGVAPVVGARFSANTADHKWGFTAQAQYLDADWGDFDDYSGDISRANALVEYRFTPRFGVYAGYDWFKLDVKRDYGDGSAGMDLTFKGPTAGVTFAF